MERGRREGEREEGGREGGEREGWRVAATQNLAQVLNFVKLFGALSATIPDRGIIRRSLVHRLPSCVQRPHGEQFTWQSKGSPEEWGRG